MPLPLPLPLPLSLLFDEEKPEKEKSCEEIFVSRKNTQNTEVGKTIIATFVTIGVGALVAFALFLTASFSYRTSLHFLVIVSIGAGIGIGILQLFYVVPIVLFFNRKRKFALMKGVIVGAAILFLVSGGCFLSLL